MCNLLKTLYLLAPQLRYYVKWANFITTHLIQRLDIKKHYKKNYIPISQKLFTPSVSVRVKIMFSSCNPSSISKYFKKTVITVNLTSISVSSLIFFRVELKPLIPCISSNKTTFLAIENHSSINSLRNCLINFWIKSGKTYT